MSELAPDPDPVPADVPRLVVVDGDERTRESIVGILGIRRRYAVVGRAGDPVDALALATDKRPDLVVLDPRLPDAADGLALIRQLRETSPATRILVLGWSAQAEGEAMAAGADCFIRKTFKPGELSAAITLCLSGLAAGAPAGSGRTG